VGAPAHHRQNDDGTMELSSALRCAALARLLLSASALHEIRASYRTARLLSLRSHSRVCLPTPLARCWWSRGRLSGSCAACRLSAHDPKAVQDGQATTQDPQDRASGFLSRPATGARANLASTRDFITFAGATTASQSCWLVLRIVGTDLILSSDGTGWWASQDDCLHPLAIHGKVFCFLGPHFPDTL
jgi:hypothetical protein